MQPNAEIIRSLNKITSQLRVSFVLGSWFMKKILAIIVLSLLSFNISFADNFFGTLEDIDTRFNIW